MDDSSYPARPDDSRILVHVPRRDTGRNSRHGDSIFTLRHRVGDNEIGVRCDQWKLYRSAENGWQLFNIDNDMGETTDVSAQHPDQVKSMISDVRAWSLNHVQPRWFDSEKVRDDWSMFKMPNFGSTFLESTSSRQAEADKEAFANDVGSNGRSSRVPPKR